MIYLARRLRSSGLCRTLGVSMHTPITAVILSGGRATRMGGIDKGLAPLFGKPLILHVIERLSPQVTETTINANRELDQYSQLGLSLLQDQHTDFIGPLAGFDAGLSYTKHDYLLTAPCDSPLLPHDLASRLLQALQAKNAEIAVASTHGHSHPVFCLCHTSVRSSLASYLASGERKVSTWQKGLRYIEVDFSDCASAFSNINTLDDLQHLSRNPHHS